jgi:hypothetical protein
MVALRELEWFWESVMCGVEQMLALGLAKLWSCLLPPLTRLLLSECPFFRMILILLILGF